MATAKRLKQGNGEFSFMFGFSGGWKTNETRAAKRVRFETELQECCQQDSDFAKYVEKYHKGYGQGIHVIDIDKIAV